MTETRRWTAIALGVLLVPSAAAVRGQLGAQTPQAPTKVLPMYAAGTFGSRVVPVLVRKDPATKKVKDKVLIITVDLGATTPQSDHEDPNKWSLKDSDSGNVIVRQANKVHRHRKASSLLLTVKYIVPNSVVIGMADRDASYAAMRAGGRRLAAPAPGTGDITIVSTVGPTSTPVETVTPEVTAIDPCD